MGYTYPAPPPNVTGGNTIEIHHMLKSPTILAQRVRTLADQKFIADFLLKGRYKAQGGAILYETGEPVFMARGPEAVRPGAAFPANVTGEGTISAADTVKWGEDVPVTDEAISRMGIDPVNRALTQLVNTMVSHVDSIALSAILSAVTATFSATGDGPGAWTSGANIAEGVLLAKAAITSLKQGFQPNAIVLGEDQWAKAVARLAAAGLLPREQNNPLVTGEWPNTLGLLWVASPNQPGTDPILVDNDQLGGMADEQIESPGYAKREMAVEAKAIRDDKHEKYDLRARRVTVPVVVEPSAGVVIEDTGL